jgi:hypothetical protein
MRRLFVPSVVLLVLSVVMMVASWFHIRVHPHGGHFLIALADGYVLVAVADDPWTPGADLVTNFSMRVAFPALPLPSRTPQLNALMLSLPTWYFVVGFAILTSLSVRPWLEARRRRRPNTCPTCGYDLSGVHSLCPECGKPINTQRATS